MFYLTHRLGQFLWDQNFEFQYFCGVSEKVTIFFFFFFWGGGGGGGVWRFLWIYFGSLLNWIIFMGYF